MPPPRGVRRAIKSEWMRQGLQVKPDEINEALANQGIVVDLDAVQRVRVELLKEHSSAQHIDGPTKQDVRKARPQKIPEKRPRKR